MSASDPRPDLGVGKVLPELDTCEMLNPDGDTFVVNLRDVPTFKAQGWRLPGEAPAETGGEKTGGEGQGGGSQLTPEQELERRTLFEGFTVAVLKDMHAIAVEGHGAAAVPANATKGDYVQALAQSGFTPT